jgi:hypothetical protein
MFEGTPSGLIFHDKNKTFSLEDVAFNSEMKAGVTALGINRVTPLIGVVTDYQLTGGDVKTSQEGFGPEVPIGLNAKRVDYVIDKGGLCLLKQLKKFNAREVRVFLVDINKVAYGTVITENASDKFRGFLATVWVTKRDNTGSQAGAIILSLFYSADYENEENNMSSVELSENIEGLTGVVLQRTGPGTAKFIIACSGDDLTSTYADDLTVDSLYKSAAGTTPVITYNAQTETLTFNPVGAYAIADAEVLKANGIEGYEGEEDYIDLT